MKKVVGLIMSCILCILLSACENDVPTEDVANKKDASVETDVKKIPAETDPRYSVKSPYIDWSGEVAVTYINFNGVVLKEFHGSEDCWMEGYPLVEIVNTGDTPLAMDDFKLESFVLKDGKEKEEESMFFAVYPAILLPEETGYMSGYTISEGWKKDAEVELTLELGDNLMTNLFDEKDFGITEVEVSELMITNDEDDEHIIISGQVKNTTATEAWINIYAVLFDANNNPVCVLNTFVEKVPVGETVDFTEQQLSYYNILAEDIATYQVVAYAH